MPVVSFKEEMEPREINWLEQGGREEIWEHQKELNSNELDQNEFVFIYLSTYSMRDELEKGEAIKEEIEEKRIYPEEVFFRIEFNSEEALKNVLDDLIDLFPNESSFKKHLSIEEIKKRLEKDKSQIESDELDESVTCLNCGQKSNQLRKWVLIQLYQPKNEHTNELGWLCPTCDKEIQIKDFKTLSEISKKLNKVNVEKANCFTCKKEGNIEEAENWWILQTIKIMDKSFGIGNIAFFCPECKGKIKETTLEDIKEILKNQLEKN